MLSQTTLFALFTAMMVFSEQSLAAPKRVCTARHQVTANFDSENYILGTALPLLEPVGTHGSLKYNGFVGLNDVLNDGVQPHSAPNEIVTGLPQALLDGTAYISANTPHTTYFDFKGFYFGCALDTVTGVVGVPVPCTITATAYYQGKKQATQDFTYTPVIEPITLPTSIPSALPSAITSALPSAITSVIGGLPSNVPSAISSVLSVAPTALPSGVSSILTELPGDLTSIIDQAPNSIPGLVSTVVSVATSLPSALPRALPDAQKRSPPAVEVKRDLPFSAHQKKAATAKAACHTGFMGVDKVTFTTTNAALVVLLLDDITYIPHHCT